MSTIKDVAKKAGVSVATVSRVINDKGKISDNTKLKVNKAIMELSYKPNTIARSLSNRRSNIVSLIVPTVNNPFFPELTRAVEDEAQANGYNVLLCNTDDKREKLEQYLDIASTRYVDGIIIDSNNITKEDLEKTRKLKIPVILIDRIIKEKDYPFIAVKNREGARIATKHLLEVGCKRIGHIQGPENENTSIQRLWGYQDIVSDLPWFNRSWIGKGEFSIRSGYKIAKELFTRHQDIDGIFAANDLIAIGALKAAYEWGKRVPNDISIVGFDGIDMSEATVPSITTIRQPIYEIGKLSMKELIKAMENKGEMQSYTLDVELEIRESTMKANISD